MSSRATVRTEARDAEVGGEDESSAASKGQWITWLKAHVDPEWRKGQWDQEAWLFTAQPGDPTTSAKYCAVVACEFVIAHGRVCGACLRALKESALPYRDFIATYVPNRRKERAPALGKALQLCCVKVGKKRCPRYATHRKLCLYHYNLFAIARSTNGELTVPDWIALKQFKLPEPESRAGCIVMGCDRQSMRKGPGLCYLHYGRYQCQKPDESQEDWAREQAPYVIDNQFTLVHLDGRLQWELLYAIQQRDASGVRLDIHAVRSVIRFLRSEPSLATATDSDVEQLLARTPSSLNVGAHLVEYFRALRNGYEEMMGLSPQDRTVWDLVDVGLSPTPVNRGSRRRKGLDFGEISQPWLRDLLMNWSSMQQEAPVVRSCFRVTVLASKVLDQSRGRGMDPAKLTSQDATSVADEIRVAKAPRGKPGSAKYRREMYRTFFDLIEYGRRKRRIEISIDFASDRHHLMPDDPVGEPCGKAIPPLVQQQLDANIDTIGSGLAHAQLPPDLVHLLFRTAYVILRDTGRRPLEIATLKRGCLQRDSHGAAILVYDNHKSRRMGRRLPIVSTTAAAIEEWRRRFKKRGHDRASHYLFPGALPRHNHLLASTFNRVLRMWVDNIDRLDTNECAADGTRVPFDRKLIHPYAFRHSYAQRFADNGVPIDVLRDLLDHASVQTTAGYYTITAERKRLAVEVVGKYAVDRSGSPVPTRDVTRYEVGSVAVPFGNCIEPSNVKAGGQACPIRFQCAGCGFYRPDPSFMPAIEEHLNSLRADRVTAEGMNADQFVIDNLNAQATAFGNVLKQMRRQLAQLDDQERERVEDASRALRKVRAGALLPIHEAIQRTDTSTHDST